MSFPVDCPLHCVILSHTVYRRFYTICSCDIRAYLMTFTRFAKALHILTSENVIAQMWQKNRLFPLMKTAHELTGAWICGYWQVAQVLLTDTLKALLTSTPPPYLTLVAHPEFHSVMMRWNGTMAFSPGKWRLIDVMWLMWNKICRWMSSLTNIRHAYCRVRSYL